MGALNLGNWLSIALVAVSCFVLCNWMLPKTMYMNFFGIIEPMEISSMRVFYATLVGLFVGAVISSVTEYYTGTNYRPVQSISKASTTGLSGLFGIISGN